jgi:outer membrane immunogenic protein
VSGQHDKNTGNLAHMFPAATGKKEGWMKPAACDAMRVAPPKVAARTAARSMLATIMLAGPACADDAPRGQPHYTAAAPVGAYSWSGPYLGVNLGYQWGYVSGNPTRPSGAGGGVQAGYNWQTGQFVFGAEADIQLSSASDTFAPWKFANPWFGAARARIGFALNQVLLYGTLGLAFGGITADSAGLAESRTHAGWAGGGGIEIGIAPQVSAKVEYLFVDLSDQAYSLIGTNSAVKSHLVRLGVNYRF